MDTDNKLTIFERRVLIKFLKDYISWNNISMYDDSDTRHLLLAFIKLQNSIDSWEDLNSYMD